MKQKTSQTKEKIIRRLKIIAGQIKGLEKMIDEDKYCVDVLNQSLAIKRAMSSLEDAVLEKHLNTHAVEQMRKGESDKAINEILSVYKLSKRK